MALLVGALGCDSPSTPARTTASAKPAEPRASAAATSTAWKDPWSEAGQVKLSPGAFEPGIMRARTTASELGSALYAYPTFTNDLKFLL